MSAVSTSIASARSSPLPAATAMRFSSCGSGGVSKSWAMPWRPSTSTSSTFLPSAARARASDAATVDLPVPPLPETQCSRACAATAGQRPGSTVVAAVAAGSVVLGAVVLGAGVGSGTRRP
jgi:hypothetical protein